MWLTCKSSLRCASKVGCCSVDICYTLVTIFTGISSPFFSLSLSKRRFFLIFHCNVSFLASAIHNFPSGCPDEKGVRPTVWRLLLYYLPPNRLEWQQFLAKQRDLYQSFIEEMIIKPGSEKQDEAAVSDHVSGVKSSRSLLSDIMYELEGLGWPVPTLRLSCTENASFKFSYNSHIVLIQFSYSAHTGSRNTFI